MLLQQFESASAIPKTLERLPMVVLGNEADLLELDSASATRSLEHSTCLPAGRGCRPASRCWSSAGLPAFGCRHIRRALLEVPTGMVCSSEVSFPCGLVFRHATLSAAVHRTAANSTARAPHGGLGISSSKRRADPICDWGPSLRRPAKSSMHFCRRRTLCRSS